MMILQAAFSCFLATSTLIIGAWIAFRFQPSSSSVGLVMGFGAGAMIAAVAYELFPETVSRDLLSFVALGAGAILFYYGTSWITRRSRAEERAGTGENSQVQTGKAIVLGALLDGIPESLVLGISLAVGGEVSLAFFGAVLISNLPEGLAAAAEMERGGMTRRSIYSLWLVVMLVCIASTVAGVILIQVVPRSQGLYVMALAAGAVLAMLSDTLIPEGFLQGGRLTGLLVVLGFAFGFVLGSLG